MTRLPHLFLLLAGAAFALLATAEAQTTPPATVDLQLDNVAGEEGGTRNLHVSAGFPVRTELILSGKLLKATADDGKDLLPQDKKRQVLISSPEPLHLFREKMRNNVTISLRNYDSAKVHALRELSGSFTCLVGDWKELDLGVAKLAAGQPGKVHKAKIEAINPWTLSGGTQTLSIFLDVPMEAAKEFVFTDAKGQPIPCRQMQQQEAPGGSLTTFLLKEGTFPPTGVIKARILEGKPVEMAFKLAPFSLEKAAK